MSKNLMLALLAAALVATPASAVTGGTADAEMQKILVGRSAGAPVSCISRGNASSATVIRGEAIVYRMGSRLFVNLTEDPARLRDDDILITTSYGSDLCNRDVIQLLSRGSQIPRGSVLLGKFIPYSARLKAR